MTYPSTTRRLLALGIATSLASSLWFAAAPLSAYAATTQPATPAAQAADPLPKPVARTIGLSPLKRKIRVVDFGATEANTTGPGATTVVIIGQIHGDEPIGPKITAYILAHPSLVPAHVHLYLIKTMNPDGAAAKTRRNARGVDLNRNFTTGWVKRAKTSRYYGGAKPLSEPESRAVMTFLTELKPDVVINVHQPLFGVDTYQVKDRALMKRLQVSLGLPLKSFSCNGGCTGSLTTWFNAQPWGSSIAVEFGTSSSSAWVARGARGILRAL